MVALHFLVTSVQLYYESSLGKDELELCSTFRPTHVAG